MKKPMRKACITFTALILAAAMLGACSDYESMLSDLIEAKKSQLADDAADVSLSPDLEIPSSDPGDPSDVSDSDETKRYDGLTGSSFQSLGYKLNDLVMEPPSAVAEKLKSLVNLSNTQNVFSFNSETASLYREVEMARYRFSQLSPSELDSMLESVQNLKPWRLDVNNIGRDGSLELYSIEELSAGSDPSFAGFMTYRATAGTPTCEEVAAVVAEAVDYDQILVVHGSDLLDNGWDYYGVARRGDCVANIAGTDYGPVVEILTNCCYVAEDTDTVDSGSTTFHERYQIEFEKFYGSGAWYGHAYSDFDDYYLQ